MFLLASPLQYTTLCSELPLLLTSPDRILFGECRVIQTLLALRFKFKTELIKNWIDPIIHIRAKPGASLHSNKRATCSDLIKTALNNVVLPASF